MSESAELLRHRSLQARCRHPQGGWIEFAHEDTERSIPDRFEKMVSRYPDRLAVKSTDGELTYRELDASANRLAHAILRQRGPAAEPVGVLGEPGIAAVVATLAVLKAGKFYVPLDPQYPAERLSYMLDDTKASLIVTDRSHRASAARLSRGRFPILSTPESGTDPGEPSPALPITAEALAGIYYTSGSTGRPKGIVYSHRYLLHNMMNYGNAFHVSPCDRWTWLHSFSFSPALTDIFCPLLQGAAVCPWNIQRDGMARLGEWLTDAEISIFHWMATPFRSFAAALGRSREFANVRLLIFGGEKLFTRDATAFREFFRPECIFVNRLGISEVGLIRYYLFDGESPLDEGVVPAGYGVPDKTVLILDAKGAELAPGEIGEIGVRSRYLPPGYWERPEITREKYVPDGPPSESRLYLTGDLGRMRSDGCLEYHGRNDAQVKVRGNRVEIDEVEKVLRELGGVREGVIKAFERPSGDSFLTAYFVPAPETAIDEAAVRRHLLQRLPAYMIPAAFVRLDRLPQNANGKIDRAQLPEPNFTRNLPSDRYAPPRTPLQRHLVEVWQQILEVRPIGIDDDFFELGGDSLRGMRMVNLVQPLLDSVLHVPPLFENPTIAAFADFLELNYGPGLRGHMTLEDPVEKNSAAGLDRMKLRLVREALAEYPIGGRSAHREGLKNPPAIFVLAPARSGTTLLRVILGGHPQLFAPPELHLLSYTTMDQRRSVLSERLQRARLDAAVHALMTAKHCSVEEAEDIIRGQEEAQLPVADFYRQLQALVAPRRLVDKTPVYAWHREVLERAEELFDSPLYIHLLRHPYGMILSYEEMRMEQISLVRRPPGISPAEFAEALWVVSHENILEFLAHIPPQRQMRVAFESLVKEPRATVAALCRFLNLDLSPAMLDPYEERQQRMTNPIRPTNLAIGDPKFHQHTAIDPSVADRWRQIYRYDFLCAETWHIAQRLGYSPTGNTGSGIAS